MSNHRIQKTLYNGVVLPVAYGALSIAARFHNKLKRTFEAQRDIRERWRAAGVRFERQPVWFHVSSVGEYEQAKPVISRLAAQYPEIPVALTFTSPSGYTYASRKENPGDGGNIKFIEYLPLDFSLNARFCLAFLNPRLLVFVKFDIWPNLVWESAARRVPMTLIDATLSASSYRTTRIGKRFYRAVYSDLDRIMAISDEDARRFNSCVPSHGGITVTGDTRFDRVMERKKFAEAPAARIDTAGRFVIVAGSTWPRDEAHVLPALATLAGSKPDLLLVLAPHEPTPEHVASLIAWARNAGLGAIKLSEYGTGNGGHEVAQVVVVDSVGVLAEIYRFADVAYIGGSFSTGVHSVIEPAIMGIPVIFGPVHQNSFEAMELLRRNAAYEIKDYDTLHARLSSLIEDDALRAQMGQHARSYVESQLGATDRCLEALAAYL